MEREMAAQPVFDGAVFIGFIVERSNSQIEASPANGPSIGCFNSPQAAAAALIAKAREAHPCEKI